MPNSAGFLSPYRVLDLTDHRGLLAGRLLAQLGADVIQVEPTGGSSARRVGPFDDTAPDDLLWIHVVNTGEVPVSITSHFHFFEVNARLDFDRAAAYGRRLAIPAGSALRFDPEVGVDAPLVPIGGARVAIGFAGLVDGPLDAPGAKEAALARAAAQGYRGAQP